MIANLSKVFLLPKLEQTVSKALKNDDELKRK